MELALFYDTETTGLPLFKEPSEDPRQPHIVQLAAKLVDLDTRKVHQSIDLITRPVGWEIPAAAAEIHGITNELACDVGIPEEDVIGMLLNLWGAAEYLRIAHNEPFDARIVRIGLKRHELDSDDWKEAGETRCTMRMAKPIVKAPPTAKQKAAGFGRGYKNPNLTEAYKHFTGRDLENAHSAMADVDACIAVYFAMKDAGDA